MKRIVKLIAIKITSKEEINKVEAKLKKEGYIIAYDFVKFENNLHLIKEETSTYKRVFKSTKKIYTEEGYINFSGYDLDIINISDYIYLNLDNEILTESKKMNLL